MTKDTSELNHLVQVAGEMMVATQTATLRLLEVEMQALAHMIPGADHMPEATEDEREQDFDNMPV